MAAAGDVESKKYVLDIQAKYLFFENPRVGWVYTSSRIGLKNPTTNRYTYKVKCTNNRMFDIRQPIGFIEPSETLDVEVNHVPGFLIPDDDAHHISIYYIQCSNEAKDYCSIWRSKKPEGCKHVFIRFPKQIIMTVIQKKTLDEKEKNDRQIKKMKEERAKNEFKELELARKQEAEEKKKKEGEKKK